MKLLDKVIIITGGGSGVGRATALKLSENGGKIIVADWNESTGLETVEMIKANGGIASFIKTDVSQFEQVECAVDFAVKQYGRLDVMFNNAGNNIHKPLLQFEPEDYDKVIKVCQYGVFNGILAAGKKMSELGIKGVIINTASAGAFVAGSHVIAYHAAKAAVKLMTQAAALELGEKGIRVVGIAPGGIDTPFIQGVNRGSVTRGDQLARAHIRGKLLKAEQIANVVAFLATDDSDVINGTTMLLDDGLVGVRS